MAPAGTRYNATFHRPFALRRLSTFRPPGARIRLRNPWVRLRRRTFG